MALNCLSCVAQAACRETSQQADCKHCCAAVPLKMLVGVYTGKMCFLIRWQLSRSLAGMRQLGQGVLMLLSFRSGGSTFRSM